MKSSRSSEYHEPDEELIELLKELGSLPSEYPAQLLNARRSAFLAQLEALSGVEPVEALAAEERELARRLTPLRSAPLEYPAQLLAARRSAFLRQIEAAGKPSLGARLRTSLQRIIPPQAGLRQISLAIASLLIAVLIGSLFLPRAEGSLQPVTEGARPLHTSTAQAAITICQPEDRTRVCLPGELHTSQDLADPGNGVAQPAVSKDARAGAEGVHSAAYVNDGRGGASWVSNSADSWIKIDLGETMTINTVSLQKGGIGTSQANDPGQFVIAVALSDVYTDGDSSNDSMEYAQVFDSEQAGFSGTVSRTDAIKTQFPPVRARFVKITFEKAGAAVDEVDVFMIPPPVLAEQSTKASQDSPTGIAAIPSQTDTQVAADPATSLPTDTWLATNTDVPVTTNTSPPAASSTPMPSLTDTLPPEDTPMPVPSDTPIPSPTIAPPTAELLLPVTDTIVVTGNDQALTFSCSGNAVVIRGHANRVTLLGSCSSITVTGNGNQVWWESGSPEITDRGNHNIILQL